MNVYSGMAPLQVVMKLLKEVRARKAAVFELDAEACRQQCMAGVASKLSVPANVHGAWHGGIPRVVDARRWGRMAAADLVCFAGGYGC